MCDAPTTIDQPHDQQLHHHHGVARVAALLHANVHQCGDQHVDEHCGQVEDDAQATDDGGGVPRVHAFTRCTGKGHGMCTRVVRGEPLRQMQPEGIEQVGEVAAPTEGHVDVADAVFHQQCPADDPGEELAEAHVGIGVRAAAHRHPRGELGIAQRREAAGHAAHDEQQHHRRPTARAGLAHAAEAARPNDRRDAEEGEVAHPQGAMQAAAMPFRGQMAHARLMFVQGPVDGFAAEEGAEHAQV